MSSDIWGTSQISAPLYGVAPVLSESALAQNGANDHFGQNDLFRTGFSIRETKMDHFGPFWPEEVHFGLLRSANRTLAIPDSQNRLQLPRGFPSIDPSLHYLSISLR